MPWWAWVWIIGAVISFIWLHIHFIRSGSNFSVFDSGMILVPILWWAVIILFIYSALETRIFGERWKNDE